MAVHRINNTDVDPQLANLHAELEQLLKKGQNEVQLTGDLISSNFCSTNDNLTILIKTTTKTLDAALSVLQQIKLQNRT